MVARWRGGAYLAVHSAESYPAALAVHVVPIEATMQQKILLAEIPSHTDCCHGYTQKGLAEGVEGVSEAKSGWSTATVAEWASRRSAAEGLDRSATLEAEKRPTDGKCKHRSSQSVVSARS